MLTQLKIAVNSLKNTVQSIIHGGKKEEDMNYKKRDTLPGYLYKGVTTNNTNKNKPFVARIWSKELKKQVWIGRYATAPEAAAAYNTKALQMYGEDAYQNDINWSDTTHKLDMVADR